MKKTIYILAVASTLMMSLAFSGCEKFLEKDPQGSLTQTSFPTTPDDALLAVNGVYATLRDIGYHSGVYPLCDIMSDDARKGSNPDDQASTIGPYDNFGFTTTGSELAFWWATLYQGIKRANVVIEKVPAIVMDETLRNRYVAEAKFLRGLFYFDLVRAWGGVPLITTLDPPMTLTRASKEAVYQQIETDLLDALKDLTEKTEIPALQQGRATKGAARALLAKVYLFEHDYVNAEKYAMEVINSGLYRLEPVFTDANGVNGEYGVESVFEVGSVGQESDQGCQYGNVQGVRGTPNRGWGFNRPTPDLRNSFEEGDPRLKGTIIDLGDIIDGDTIQGDGPTPDITLDEHGNVLETECYNRKVWTPGTNVPTQFGHNRRILRYADVLLMAAEALNQNDKPDQALIYLNKVRERAREGNNAILPDITVTDKDALQEIILNERRHELALEGHRFWDLVRTGKAAEVLGPLGFVAGKHELFPIPQTERDISQGAITQNPNW
ncbi:MAG TPA: RagB/SusD family nutrient uptake outer membrane protein [Bacteroidales bacterium]|nr:RagB/SusD family nutrient uptake outer membrane protein [Bacteroidales bacterium]HPT02567.1 RagB/SusD family nutrient uptake outer membrane protein [Bacteroidales bacterium]